MAAHSLKNKFIVSLFAVFAFFLRGASDAGTDRVLVSAMEGDSVTLHTNITVNQQERMKWYFIDALIAKLSHSDFCTDVKCNKDAERFRDRLKLDRQTGDLTITNISTSDVGVYQLRIFSSSSSTGNGFDVSVHDVAAEMKRKLVEKGESVTLVTPKVKSLNNVMTWYFNDTLITEITGDPSKICTDVQCKERFSDRLEVDQFGSLIITKTRMTDSGIYKLKIKSSENLYTTTSVKSFNVSVTDSGLSSAAIAGICVAGIVVVVVVLVLVAASVIYCRRRSSSKDKESPHNGRGSQHRAGIKINYSAPPFHRQSSLLDEEEGESEIE